MIAKRVAIGVAVVWGLCAWAGLARGVTIDLVVVGDPGNVADTEVMSDGTTGYGSVAYPYWIGKYEVTNGQYREFLNAKAALGDPYGLYHPDMAEKFGGIERRGDGNLEDPWVYWPKGGDAVWDLHPVNYVCWYDAIRFANWLQNGQGDGDTESGTYPIANGGSNSGDVTVPTAAERAAWTARHYVLPSEDEWYKAAYYKGGSPDAGYWDYATQSDETPNNNPPWLDTGNSANYVDNEWAIGGPYYSNEVGAYVLSVSAYGTFDQTGNMWEWTEAEVQQLGGMRVARGGAMHVSWLYILARDRATAGPALEGLTPGFRVGAVPEPSALVLILLAALGLGLWGRRLAR